MAVHWFTGAKLKLAQGALNLATVDLRSKLVMTNTSADTDIDATSLSGITTIDEYNGTGYSEIDFTGQSLAADNTNDRAELTVSAGSYGSAVGAGARNWQGHLYYVRVDGNPANDYPVAFIDITPQANGNGGALNFTPNAEGLLQVG